MSEGALNDEAGVGEGSDDAVRAGLSRRGVMVLAAKAGTAAAAVAWVAPRLETVAYAAGAQGSPCPNPNNPACNTTTSSSSSTTAPPTVTCGVDPRAIQLGDKPRFFGTGWKAASTVKVVLVGSRTLGEVTVKPDGTFDARFEVVRSVTPGTYRVEFVGFDADGRSVRCFETLVVNARVTPQGSTTTVAGGGTGGQGGQGGQGAQNGNGNGGTGGSLPFTGTDPGGLVAVGVGAIVIGRVLYGLRSRLGAREIDITNR